MLPLLASMVYSKNVKTRLLLNDKITSLNWQLLIKGTFFGIISITFFGLVWFAGDFNFGLITLSLMLVLGYFFIQKRIEVFDPFSTFSFYYFSVIFSSYHLYSTRFYHNPYIENQSFAINLNELFTLTQFYLILSYIFAYLGYLSFRNKCNNKVVLNKDEISLKVVNCFIIIFAFAGFANFAWNIFSYAGGSPITYMANVALRHDEWSAGGTTIFYLLSYYAGYLWLYKILRKGKRINFLFLSYCLFTIFMKATTGRIIGTMVYALTYIVIYHFAKEGDSRDRNWKYFLLFISLAIISLAFYFFRVSSSIIHMNHSVSDYLTLLLNFGNLESILYFAVSKGNIPNVAVLMKILEGWGRDIPFLYGESLVTWLLNGLPSFLRPENYQPSLMIKHVWYSHVPGGALPPTGMGEMYANFSWLGAICGMYIFGAGCAVLRNFLVRFNNYWYLLIYSNILLGFVMIYPKGEFDNLTMWSILPFIATYLLLRFFSVLANRKLMLRFS